MRRARSTDNSNTVSLFPFLAVLLCTMGALIVLLVVMARQAKVQAAQAAQAEVDLATSQTDSAKDLDELNARIVQLQLAHKAATEKLGNHRSELSHLEDHMRRLAGRLAQMQEVAEQLRTAGENKILDRQHAEAEVARIQQLVEETAEKLEKARREASQRRPSYAIIPYEGTGKTLRRPIYIECDADYVILQPEGIRLGPDDFREPMGPGNPLASALRAAGEYYLLQADTTPGATGGASEPYPLILVRPKGLWAYYKVRQAIESWGSDFGYELVEQDWELEFPLPNPELARAERHAVELARALQKRLARAAPSKYGGLARPTNRATARSGGFQREADAQQGQAGGFEQQGGGSFEEGTGPDRGSYASRRANGPAGSTSRQARAGGLRNDLSPRYPTDSTESQGPTGGPTGGFDGPDAAPFADRMSTEQQTSSESAQKSEGSGSSGSMPFGSVQAPIGQPDGAQPAGAQAGQGSQGGAGDPLANQRGEDWALPSRRSGAVPLSRPVRVVCRIDRLAILPDQDWQQGKVIFLREHTEEAIDEFVSALWDHMQGWGIAGRGLYWRPILELNVGPNGRQRAADLERLLQDSGIEVQSGPLTASP